VSAWHKGTVALSLRSGNVIVSVWCSPPALRVGGVTALDMRLEQPGVACLGRPCDYADAVRAIL